MSLKCPDKTPSKKEIKNKLLQCNGNVTKSNTTKDKNIDINKIKRQP